MRWYIIDAWNVIHKLPTIKAHPLVRQEFVLFIKKNRLTGSRNNRVTLVYDGVFPYEEIERESQFEIVFSNDKTADEVIVVMVSRIQQKKQLIVVSDDREVRQRVLAQGAVSMPVHEFLKRSKSKKSQPHDEKNISVALKREIDEELKRYW